MKLTDKQIVTIIKEIITREENQGTHAGGSGHLADIGFRIDHLEIIRSEKEFVRINFFYTVTISTEFTIYPDNPPYEYRKKNFAVINYDGEIIERGNKNYYSLNELPANIHWQFIQNDINQNIEKILSRIEWHYGDCRAPFEYPPEYSEYVNNKTTVYRCCLNTYGKPEDNIIIEDYDPDKVLSKLTVILKERYNFNINNDLELC